MKIGIIIPTVYKLDCLDLSNAVKSLAADVKQYTNLELDFLIFVDRAPIDFSPINYQKNLQILTRKKIMIMYSHLQIGFTGAVNQAIESLSLRGKYDWVLVFNDDAVALSNFWSITKQLKRQAHGLVSGGVMSWQSGVESLGLQANKWGMTLPITKELVVSKKSGLVMPGTLFSGTYFFVSTETVRKLLELNRYFFFPLFFAYAEDFELGVRLHRLGEPVSVLPKLLIKHKGSQTTKRGSAFQLFYGLRNDFFVHWLHHRYDWQFFRYVYYYWLYVIGLCLYKGYWFLPAKIALSHWKNRATITFWRSFYDQRLPYYYPF